jgi:hypothetical protein
MPPARPDVALYPYLHRVLEALGEVQARGDGWDAACPCPTHGRDGVDGSKNSLRITVGEEGKVCLKCRVGCPVEGILDAVGLRMGHLFPYGGEEPYPLELASASSGSEGPGRMELQVRDKVYRAILERHLELRSETRGQLVRRGLDHARLVAGEYVNLSANEGPKLAHDLVAELGEDPVYATPGFYRDAQGKPACAATEGLVIPIRDRTGLVVAFKTRRYGNAKPKYLYWSSARYQGPSPGTPVHWPVGAFEAACSKGLVRITEGELKADVAFHLSGLPTFSVPGVGVWERALPELEALKARGVTKILLTFDLIDVQDNSEVAGCLHLLTLACKERGFQVGTESWPEPEKYKGVDDALVAAQPLTQHWPTEQPGAATLPEPVATWEPPAFPLDVLPEPVRGFVGAVAEELQCPVDFPAVAALAVAARAVGTTCRVALGGNWKEFCNLWLVTVAKVGAAKSPAFKTAMAPIKFHQQDQNEKHAESQRSYRRLHDKWKADAARARRSKGPQPPQPAEPEPPTHYYLSDYTMEVLAVRLDENARHGRHDPSLLVYLDEVVSLTRAMNQYKGGRGTDRSNWLSGWSNEDIKVDRKTDNLTLMVSAPAVTLFGGIQPEVLSELVDRNAADDGFFARFLFSMPREMPDFDPAKRPPAGAAFTSLARAWRVVVSRLLLLKRERHLAQHEQPADWFGVGVGRTLSTGSSTERPPEDLPLTPAAQTAWAAALARHNAQKQAPWYAASFDPCWPKFRAYLGRLALLLHLVRVACGQKGVLQPPWRAGHPDEAVPPGYSMLRPILSCGEVDEEDVVAAEALVDYFKAMLCGVDKALPIGPADRRLREFAAWVQSKPQGKVTLRQVYHNHHFGCRGKKEARQLFLDAADRALGQVVTATDTKHRGPVFVVNRPGESEPD